MLACVQQKQDHAAEGDAQGPSLLEGQWAQVSRSGTCQFRCLLAHALLRRGAVAAAEGVY